MSRWEKKTKLMKFGKLLTSALCYVCVILEAQFLGLQVCERLLWPPFWPVGFASLEHNLQQGQRVVDFCVTTLLPCSVLLPMWWEEIPHSLKSTVPSSHSHLLTFKQFLHTSAEWYSTARTLSWSISRTSHCIVSLIYFKHSSSCMTSMCKVIRSHKLFI